MVFTVASAKPQGGVFTDSWQRVFEMPVEDVEPVGNDLFLQVGDFLGGWSMQGGSPSLTSHLTVLDNWKSLLQA